MNDSRNEQVTKVEPRIMHVLKILIENSPNVVSRETLITEVWNNYGGADDALNQAISHIRKLLSDNDKNNRIIETVIKKGYRIGPEKFSRAEDKIRTKKMNLLIIVFIVMIIVASTIYIIWQNPNAPSAPLPDTPKSEETTTRAPKSD